LCVEASGDSKAHFEAEALPSHQRQSNRTSLMVVVIDSEGSKRSDGGEMVVKGVLDSWLGERFISPTFKTLTTRVG
jgi:hypothetical protein